MSEFIDEEADDDDVEDDSGHTGATSTRAVWDSHTTQRLTDYLGTNPEATAAMVKRDVFKGDTLSAEQIQRKMTNIRRANKSERRQSSKRNKRRQSSSKSSDNSHQRSGRQSDSNGSSSKNVANVDVTEKVVDMAKLELVQMLNEGQPDDEVIASKSIDGKYTIFSWSMSYNEFGIKVDSTERRLYRIVHMTPPPEADLKSIFGVTDLTLSPQNSERKYFFTMLAEDLDLNTLQLAQDVKNQKYLAILTSNNQRFVTKTMKKVTLQ